MKKRKVDHSKRSIREALSLTDDETEEISKLLHKIGKVICTGERISESIVEIEKVIKDHEFLIIALIIRAAYDAGKETGKELYVLEQLEEKLDMRCDEIKQKLTH